MGGSFHCLNRDEDMTVVRLQNVFLCLILDYVRQQNVLPLIVLLESYQQLFVNWISLAIDIMYC